MEAIINNRVDTIICVLMVWVPIIVVYCLYKLTTKITYKYSTKCPCCHRRIFFVGNLIKQDNENGYTITDFSKYKSVGYPHIYKCPYCGTTKTVQYGTRDKFYTMETDYGYNYYLRRMWSVLRDIISYNENEDKLGKR